MIFGRQSADAQATELLRQVTRILAESTSIWSDDVWIANSTPVGCGRCRETMKRSNLAGWAQYGYCASHSRFFWGLRPHLVCTFQGLPARPDRRDPAQRPRRTSHPPLTHLVRSLTPWN